MIYRRAIRLVNKPGLTECELEDDFHHFRVRLQHDKQRILKVEGDSVRFPWTTCGAEAASQLPQLENLKLGSLYSQLSNERRFHQCTHLFDMAHYAAVHATRDQKTRLYEAAVTVVSGEGAVEASLCRSDADVEIETGVNAGSEVLRWALDRGEITSPGEYQGYKVSELSRWTQNASEEVAEAVHVLQRAVHVSFGKGYDWSYAKTADAMQLPPTCYTFDRLRAGRAQRVPDNIRDFTEAPESLLAGTGRSK